MIKINLLASDLIKKEERNDLIILAYAIVILAVMACGFDYAAKFRSYKILESRVSQSEKELTKYQSILKEVEALQTEANILETKKGVINTLMQGRLTYLYFMEDILEVLPNNLWFKTINTQTGADGVTVNMDADALDNYAIADFVSSLSASPFFSSVDLGAIATSSGGKTPVSTFHLKFNYKKKNI